MRTREQSLNDFANVLDSLIDVKYLFAGARIFDVLKTINSSKLLLDIFNYFSDGFDFELILSNALIENEEGRSFVLPEKNTDAITLVYLLLREINNKNAQLTDLLDYFDGAKNYEIAYRNFASEVLVPFKNYTLEIGGQIINSTKEQSIEIDGDLNEPDLLENNSDEKPIIEPTTKVDNSSGINIYLLRLLDLDRLSITQSRQKEEEKDELLYVLDIFVSEIKGGDASKIRLAYLAYYYALKPYRKIQNNLKEITENLIENKII